MMASLALSMAKEFRRDDPGKIYAYAHHNSSRRRWWRRRRRGTITYPTVTAPAPPVAGITSDIMVARWPGNVPLVTQGTWYSTSGSVYADFVEAAPDQTKLAATKAQGLEQRIYYFNEQYQKWVALASYPQADGTVLVKNDGGYNNVWMTMYAVRQPDYTDIAGHWAEDVINRMNGLALIEGYPIPGDPNTLERTAGPDRNITRAEFVTILARALGCLPTAEQKLYDVVLPRIRSLCRF